MSLVFSVVVVIISVVSIFNVIFELIVFLNFDLDLDLEINVVTIFLDHSNKLCNLEEMLLLPMMSTAVLKMLLMIMFYFLLPRAVSDSTEAMEISVCKFHHQSL